MGQAKFWLKIPRLHLGTYSTLHSHSISMFNRSFNQIRIPWSHSIPFNNLKQVQNHKSGVYSPRYFHAIHSVNNQPHQIHFPFQMSWPTIAKCYEDIVEDPSLLWLFLWEEYSSIQELPCFGTLQFRLISEEIFYMHCFSWHLGEHQGGISHPNQSKEEWRNHQVSSSHHWWGRREN